MTESLLQLLEAFETSVSRDNFVKLTLSKPLRKSDNLSNVYIRQIVLKEDIYFQFLYRHTTYDQVKNYTLKESKLELEQLLKDMFRACVLFTLENDLQVFISKKKKVSYKINKPSFKNKLPENHDKIKVKRAVNRPYLQYLGITDKNDNVIPKMADKFRQINKYLEIIEVQLRAAKLPTKLHIVDMGSGKGYLTFALYDYLVDKGIYDVSITGIELRENLVTYCNTIAKKCDFSNLHFVAQKIQDYSDRKIDILIALHACDTATDDAIYKGLVSQASLIICAPCCHKQIRQQVKGKSQKDPILKYGIFKERQFEMVTDTIRALILEKNNYTTNVFEFISNEHTRKNVMLTAVKSTKRADIESIEHKIEALKNAYSIDAHYLETLL